MNKDDFCYFLIWIPFLLIAVPYFLLGLGLLCLDLRAPAWYVRWKVKGRRSTGATVTTLCPAPRKLMRVLLFNFGSSLMITMSTAWALLARDLTFELPAKETPYEAIGKFVVSMFLSDTYFYHSHFLMHTRWFYKYVHSLHHEAVEPFGLVTNYCSLPELFIVNLPTVFVGPTVTRMSLPLYYGWILTSTVYTMLEHSGLRPIFFMDPTHHYRHHSMIRGNYGLSPLWDTIYGTVIRRQKRFKGCNSTGTGNRHSNRNRNRHSNRNCSRTPPGTGGGDTRCRPRSRSF